MAKNNSKNSRYLEKGSPLLSIYRKNLEDDDPEKSEIDDILKNLKQAIEGKFKFTLKISDPQGGSYIIPQDKSKYTFKKIEKKKLE